MGIVENLMSFTFAQISHAADIATVDCIPLDADLETAEQMLEFLAPAREALVDKMVASYLS